jgi:quercetin dioxygenase-like cupin family protein
MRTRLHFYPAALAASLLLCGAAPAQAPAHAAGKNITDMQFNAIPPLPTCVNASVQNGDPAKGPFIILAKVKTGCTVPWHWHTANEHLMIVSGAGRAEMKNGEAITLKSAGFVQLPSKQVHKFKCERECTFYLYSDGAFDIHYVDAKDAELTPEDALKAVKETVAKAPK